MPPVANYSWDIDMVPLKKIKISKLIFDTLLWAGATEALM
jgi:hypothetical protein